MKFWKWSLMAMTVLMVLLPLSAMSGEANAREAPIAMMLDGQALASDVAPYVTSGTALVPLRVISNGIGASVVWNQTSKSVTIQKDGSTIKLTLGKKTATVNGGSVTLDVPLQAVAGRTMAPLRFVGEHLGLTVSWNQAARVITLTTPGWENGGGSGNLTGSNSLRGAWIASVMNLDWPSSLSKGNEEMQKQEYTRLLDDLQAAGINAVFLQVRPAADALYRSSLIPWSQYLTGNQGKDPGYDPLAFVIEETHKRGMQFHAWFNPFRATASGSDSSKLASNHVSVQHPEWIIDQGGKLYINPGIPAARQHIIDAVMEVVDQYDIDGVHLDDYFYPHESDSDPFEDDLAFKEYNPKGFQTKGDWRRDNINTFVRDLDQSIHGAKPQVSFGISPFGIWRNSSADPTGSDTSGTPAYDNMYADARTWIQNGYIDYIAPQVYWSFDNTVAAYNKVVDWWANEVSGTSVKLYIGHAPYKIGSPQKGWQTAQEIIDQLKYNERYDQIQGSIFYNASHLRKNPLGLIELLRTYYGLN
ncbi:family 10 glycosylhydrolase [Paenibacillus caui]|uniref:family 10 glycosylhydrolase n=1 Tax=Paenibacillus caui TaxID=2873927 RepID=UPI001CA7D23C|nr:family 10 glycosylhydrolase [Paenibacillus caui]